MNVEAFLAAAGRLPVAPLDTLVGTKGLVVVAPHPDDESLGCGGLIAEARRLGRAVRLVVVTDGCGSHTHSALYPPERLRALREDETRAAVAELGLAPEDVRFLRLPDAHAPSAGPQAEAAAAAILDEAEACDAGAVFVTWGHDPHCDHKASAAIVGLAQALRPALPAFAYPVWGWTLPPGTEVGDAPEGYRLDVSAHRPAKAKAVAAHRSQTTDLIHDDPTGFRLAPEMLAHFQGPHEIFLRMKPVPGASRP
ncbi:GlcNAc-PI de-N-acetylase [Methylobacterium sp. Leaf99]|uniref:PIG-L deacetylase family protein n=1 Tax=Methylobacterium sp. Leaf99 TaxID=1736251 RepID=UPI0006F4BEE2|nr:PIG-L family deacetylase [Methylobacterium sp. Leaf99]KQP10295.1 GlcNAc-PI de-N-acetylase [Methylobacterium sp. Leaf99]